MNKKSRVGVLFLALSLSTVVNLSVAATPEKNGAAGANGATAIQNAHLPAALQSAIDGIQDAKTPEQKAAAHQALVQVVAMLAATNPAAAATYTAAAVAAAPDAAAAITAAAVAAAPSAGAAITRAAVTVAPAKAGLITAAATGAAPQQSQSIVAAVLTVPGVNPLDVTAPAAAGNAGSADGARTAGTGTPAHNHFSVPSFTPASTGGGGGRAASPA